MIQYRTHDIGDIDQSSTTLHIVWREEERGTLGWWAIEDMTAAEVGILIDDIEEVCLDDPSHHSGTYEWSYVRICDVTGDLYV